MTQKEKESEVLKKFIDEFDSNITILSLNEAKSIFPNYNEENPDFIILHKTGYIGIELFELVSSKNQNILMSKEEKNLAIQNLPHLKSIREQLGTKLLYENEQLAKVAVERINDKVLHKIKNYVTDKIWFLGYADKPYNFKLLDTEIENNTVNLVLKYIKENILPDNKIDNIFLFQCGGNYKLFNIVPKAL